MRLHSRAALYFWLQKMAPVLFICLWLAVMFGPNAAPSQQVRSGFQWYVFAPLMFTAVKWLAAVLVCFGVFCYFKARAYRIELRKEGIALDYGVLNKSHETLLYGKIQDILISRSVLERVLGLSTVVIQNAMGQPQKIPGLGFETATEFRDDILKRTQ